MKVDRHRARAAWLVLLALGTLGCARGCTSPRPPIHVNPNMDDQEKYLPQSESRFFYDGMTMRRPVAGTIARGELPREPEFYSGRNADGSFLAAGPLAVDDALLARGRRGYAIYCSPCHDPRGLGRGVLFQYANVPTASLHDEQRRGYPDGQIFDIITNGSGLMQGYRYPITPADRWAIVARVREMQQERLATEVAAAR
jgi:mono/diheme cytochrome c family protein